MKKVLLFAALLASCSSWQSSLAQPTDVGPARATHAPTPVGGTAPDNNIPGTPNNLRDNFGIPENLSDCDVPSEPITPDMNEGTRKYKQVMNDTVRSTCQLQWQAHQYEVQSQKDRVEAKAAEDRVKRFTDFTNSQKETDPDGSLRAGAAAVANLAIQDDIKKRQADEQASALANKIAAAQTVASSSSQERAQSDGNRFPWYLLLIFLIVGVALFRVLRPDHSLMKRDADNS
jgi:hypothetical protein